MWGLLIRHFSKIKNILDGKSYLIIGLCCLFGWMMVKNHYREQGLQEAHLKQIEHRETQIKSLLKEQKQLESKVSDLENKHRLATQEINQQALKIKEMKEDEADRVITNHLNGTDRLSIPVIVKREPRRDCPSPNTHTKRTRDTDRTHHTERHELHPDVARLIFDTTKRADKYVNERNQCVKLLSETKRQIEEYNEVIRKLNQGELIQSKKQK